MLSLFWDLDGVLRNLHKEVLSEDPKTWDWKKNGKSLVEIVDENRNMLVDADPTKYFNLASSLPDISILTRQPDPWRDLTMKWLDTHFLKTRVYLTFVESMEEKIKLLKKYPKTFLIDDFPGFSDYSRVILIDHAYNKKVKKPYRRVKTVEELRGIIFD